MSIFNVLKSTLQNIATTSLASVFRTPSHASSATIPALSKLTTSFDVLDTLQATSQKYFKLINALDRSPINTMDYPKTMESNAVASETSPKTTTINAEKIFEKTEGWKGTPYLYGGNSIKGIDCSHFVHQAYKAAGLDYGYHSTASDWEKAGFEKTTDPKAGDLIMFDGHMGIVVDPVNQIFIGAQSSTGVAEASYAPDKYWGKKNYSFLHHPQVMNC